ncbi:hypothetical protein QBC45DRAFT_422636 [Copromyces sp. CBS 386.78]|nr:hypothetical protein QBC45DRAFT_422636 [Copromyces sp. CBS 386.78]
MVKLPDLALSLPLLALNFGLLAFQVFAAPTVAGSDVAPISAEPTWRLYRGSDPEGAISSASTTAAHLARRDDDSWIQCSDDSKFKVKVSTCTIIPKHQTHYFPTNPAFSTSYVGG